MKNNRRPLLITGKDVAIITGRSTRYGYRLLARIKRKMKKQPWQPVSFEEFCHYMALDPEQVYRCLGM